MYIKACVVNNREMKKGENFLKLRECMYMCKSQCRCIARKNYGLICGRSCGADVFIHSRSSSVTAFGRRQIGAKERKRERSERNKMRKMGNIGHEARWPGILVIIYCQREALLLFRSYASLQRKRVGDEREELIRDVSRRDGTAGRKREKRKKKRGADLSRFFMNRRCYWERFAVLLSHWASSEREKQSGRISILEIVRDTEAGFALCHSELSMLAFRYTIHDKHTLDVLYRDSNIL